MVDISEDGSRSVLKYLPAARGLTAEEVMQDKEKDSLDWHALLDRYKHMRHMAIMHLLMGPARLNQQDAYPGLDQQDAFAGLMEQDEVGGEDVSDDDDA
jgi:hypothetical protein